MPKLGFGGGMSKSKEQLLANSSQVWEAERRLAVQHTFIGRLRAGARDTRAAEQALEVMRDILRQLYQERSQLRRKQSARAPRKSRPLDKGAVNGRRPQ